jgi:hypothetical protein
VKILLLSSVPPCRNWAGGLVLDQFCRFLPKDSAACFVISGVAPDPDVSSELSWMPIVYRTGPRQHVPRLRFAPAQYLASRAIHASLVARHIPRLVDRVVDFAKDFGADALWATLEGSTLIHAALPVAERLGIPLMTQVFDPPDWWLRQSRFDATSVRRIQRQFDRTVRASRCCAVASWPMAEEYRERFGVNVVPFFSYLDSALAGPPAREPLHSDRLVIGLAGKIYAIDEWKSLLAALDSAAWHVAGRKVSIRLIGHQLAAHAPQDELAAGRIEVLDWLPQNALIRKLSEVDVGYCPYWFDPAFAQESRLSFPSKIVSYFAAGRPVLFHGPDDASPARFLNAHRAGLCCRSRQPGEILLALERLATDGALYSALTAAGNSAFHRFFDMQACRATLQTFLGVDEQFLLPASPTGLRAA